MLPNTMAPPDDVREVRRTPEGPRISTAVIAVLALLVVTLGALLAVQLTSDDAGGTGDVPDDVQDVLDDFLLAVDTYDYDLLQEIVTDDFRRPSYIGDPDGSIPYRSVQGIEYFDFFEEEEPQFEVERIGEPIVRGDGPWYVAIAEDWNYVGQSLRYETIYTFAIIVDTDGVLRIDDAYWVGHQVFAEGV